MTLLSRRSALRLAAAATVGTAARRGLAQPAIGKGTTLTVSTWGGVTSDGLRDHLAPEFEKLTGAKLAFDIGGLGARYNKLLAQKGNQSADVFYGTDESIVGGLHDGVLEYADEKALPNYADLYEWAKTVKAPAGQVGLVASTLISYVLAYNPEKVKTPPKAWADMWDPAFAGKLAFAAPAHSQMPAFVIVASELAGGSAENVDPGFAKLAKLRPNKLTVFWTDWAPMLKTGDTIAATEFDYYLETMKAQGYPIDYVFPAEKAFGAAEGAALVAGTKNKEIAQAFLDLTIDPKLQAVFAEAVYWGPTNKLVKPTPAVAAKMSYGEAKMQQIRFFDPEFCYRNRPAWTERMTT
ncbi:MAG TPA: ABC transporter substrate-binding protein, partial [Rhodopila sp.]|uniref:ABC transporter substrate-binding protein n=1 Tax=Rhodopila sp. TaxID=2480087 RepID=UPI002CB9AE98